MKQCPLCGSFYKTSYVKCKNCKCTLILLAVPQKTEKSSDFKIPSDFSSQLLREKISFDTLEGKTPPKDK